MIIIVINNEMRNTDKDDRQVISREKLRTGDRSIAQVISREKLCAPAIVRSPLARLGHPDARQADQLAANKRVKTGPRRRRKSLRASADTRGVMFSSTVSGTP